MPCLRNVVAPFSSSSSLNSYTNQRGPLYEGSHVDFTLHHSVIPPTHRRSAISTSRNGKFRTIYRIQGRIRSQEKLLVIFVLNADLDARFTRYHRTLFSTLPRGSCRDCHVLQGLNNIITVPRGFCTLWIVGRGHRASGVEDTRLRTEV